jgi:poly(hydroxyalkanoate) depolymerase family esterase
MAEIGLASAPGRERVVFDVALQQNPLSMNPFLRKLLAAGGLTRRGHLAEATRAIQRTLSTIHEAGAHTSALIQTPPEGRSGAVGGAEEVGAPTQRAPGKAGFFASSYTGAAGTRAFKLFVPDGFGDAPLPLVVMLHGCTQDPDDFAAGTQMNALAQEQGFLVLYPQQAPRSNAQKCWNWFSPADQRRGAGEPALLAGMTRHVLQTHNVDPDRVYVAGLSAGGAMAAILAREYPDLFAAAGVHSGVAPGAAHDVASAFAVMKSGPGDSTSKASGVPLIVFHGGADQTVVAANGDAVVRAALGNTPVLATSSAGVASGRSFRRTVWRPADDAGAPGLVEHWVVDGAPHAWSGGDASGSYTDPGGPDASREMLRFFREHRRRRG